MNATPTRPEARPSGPPLNGIDRERAAELLNRAAASTRHEAYSEQYDSPRRTVLLDHARALVALGENIEAFGPDVARLEFVMTRAIQLALAQLDPQLDAGVPKPAQEIDYHLIFAQVRGEMADRRLAR